MENATKKSKEEIALGKDAFTKRKELLRGKMGRNLKKRMVKTLVWSVVLYGSEERRYKEAFEMWIWRKMEKISWMEHITNEEVLNMVDEERDIIRTIRERQRKWIGHTLRSDSLLRTVIEANLKVEWRGGRQ